MIKEIYIHTYTHMYIKFVVNILVSEYICMYITRINKNMLMSLKLVLFHIYLYSFRIYFECGKIFVDKTGALC